MENLEEIKLEDIEEKVIFFNIAKSYKTNSGANEEEILKMTERAWNFKKDETGNKNLAKYAFAMYLNIVRGIFIVKEWKELEDLGRWIFKGDFVYDDIKDKYLKKRISGAWKRGDRTAFKYSKNLLIK